MIFLIKHEPMFLELNVSDTSNVGFLSVGFLIDFPTRFSLGWYGHVLEGYLFAGNDSEEDYIFSRIIPFKTALRGFIWNTIELHRNIFYYSGFLMETPEV